LDGLVGSIDPEIEVLNWAWGFESEFGEGPADAA
jgi:hypothetical protein